MNKSNTTMAQQIAEAASAFEQRRTGHAPQWVTVVLSLDTLVITLHGALSRAERALAKSPAMRSQPETARRRFRRSRTPQGCSPPAGDEANVDIHLLLERRLRQAPNGFGSLQPTRHPRQACDQGKA